MLRRTIPLIALLAGLSACGTADAPTALPLGTEAGLAKGAGGGSVLYKARLIVAAIGEGDGELASGWFPPAGFSVSASNPWKQVSIGNVTLNLINATHGSWEQGQCAVFVANFQLPWNLSNWNIFAGTDSVRTYAGTWSGTVTFSKGYFAFDGDRVGAPGGIHNVVTQNNAVVETVGPDKDWFRHEVRNAPFKFGSASTPDGAPLDNAEVACVNYTIELRKATLIGG